MSERDYAERRAVAVKQITWLSQELRSERLGANDPDRVSRYLREIEFWERHLHSLRQRSGHR